MKTPLKYLKIFVILIASFFAFSVLSCLIPYESIRKNIEKSLPRLLEEGIYPRVIFNQHPYMQDNFTDALILNAAASSNPKKPVWSAMAVCLSSQSSDVEGWDMIGHLQYKVENPDLLPNGSYSRYWFGSVPVCRILLLTMNYQQIKWFLYLVSTLLLLLFAVNIVNRVGWIKSLPIFLALLFANFFVTQFSMQFFPVMAIALIGGIWMCKNGLKPQKKISLFLFIIGMFTAYFDLLTAPLLTLGLPLIVYMILHSREDISIMEIFKTIVVLCLCWLMGYAGAWAIKWVLVVIFADSAAIDMAISAIKYRTTTEDYTRWDAVVRNLDIIPLVWLNIVLTCLFLLTIFFFNKKGMKWAVAFLSVGLLPYMWYFVLSSHSHPHWWFTYRTQIISMSCAMLVFVSLIDWEKVKMKLKIKDKTE